MSLKHELEVWISALEAFDAREYDSALRQFEKISYYSKVLFNTAVIHATRGQHERAITDFARAITLDPFFAVAHFQLGVSAFLLGQMEEARKSFDRALSLFHDNHTIDYRQLGLDFQLYSCEVRFNRGLSMIYSGRLDLGMQDLKAAQADKQSEEHDVIDEAIADQAVGYTVFSIPVGIVFRPPSYKIENLETRDYLGKAKVIAATEAANLFVGFAGTRIADLEAGKSASDGARPVPSRSMTSAGRLERGERGDTSTSATAIAPEASLRRSRTAKPSLAMAAIAPSFRSQAAASVPPSAAKELAGAADGATQQDARGPKIERSASPSRRPLAAGSVSAALRPRGRSNTTTNTSPRLRRSRSFAERNGAAPSDAFFPVSPPSRPATRPPPLDLGMLRPPISPGHRRTASSPAALSPVPTQLPYGIEEPGRFAKQQAQQSANQQPKRDFIQDLPPLTDNPHDDPSTMPKSGNTAGLATATTVSRTSSAFTEARDILASACAALRTDSPPLMRTASKADAGRPALARIGTVQRQAGTAAQDQQFGPIVASPESEGSVGRSELYEQYASMSLRESPATSAMKKVRIKLHWREESMQAGTTLQALRQHVQAKLGLDASFNLQFRDVDGSCVSVQDEEDWECALDIAREGMCANGDIGRLEMDVLASC
ncbi:hypothetical protein JCM10908_003943 [Rhodotorula pacifica]|uniref:uncharacterized protein n=1 Tax=Rhodotorula pacifica TaxID=1495444 RepID=UPI0031742EAD